MPNLDNIHDKFFPKAKTAHTGKFLIKLAWSIEIFVALTALAISVILLFSQGQSDTKIGEISQRWVSMDMGASVLSLAFVVVAIMELTKIPLATAFYYSAKIRWRTIFFIGLFAVNFSTFETFITAFELRYHQMSQQVDGVRNEIENIDEQLATLVIKSDPSELKTIIMDINVELNNLENRKIDIQQNLDEKISGISIDIGNLISNINAQKQEDLAELNIKKEDELAAARTKGEKANPIIEQNTETIKQLRKDNQRLVSNKANIEKEIQRLERDFNSVQNTILGNADDQERARIRSKINEKEREIRVITADINDINDQIDILRKENKDLAGTTGTTTGTEIDRIINNFETQRNQIIETANSNIDTLEQQRDDRIESAENAAKSDIAKLQSDIDAKRENQLQPKEDEMSKLLSDLDEIALNENDLLDQRDLLEAELNEKAKNNQIYRMAEKINTIAALFGSSENNSKSTKGKSDLITQGELDRAFWLWFGALSVVLSIIGTLVAFAGLHLQDERMHVIRNKKMGPNKFLRRLSASPLYMNRFLWALRKRLMRPVKITEKVEVVKVKEKIVEKPVINEKIVFHKIEVPKEVVKKEIVYVPLPTDDPEILKKGPFSPKMLKDDDPSSDKD